MVAKVIVIATIAVVLVAAIAWLGHMAAKAVVEITVLTGGVVVVVILDRSSWQVGAVLAKAEEVVLCLAK